jgi:hypothetical protein
VVNASQVLAVGVTLRLIEEAAEEIERLLSAASAGTTYRLVDDLTPAERETIRTCCGQAREALGRAAARMRTEIAERSLRQEIRERVTTAWVTLEETTSKALRGYGPLSREDGVIVDDLLDAVSRPVECLFRLVEGPLQQGVAGTPSVAATRPEDYR